MPRPKKERKVHKPPIYSRFKPSGIPAKGLKEIILTLDEYEAIRLADFMGMLQEEAAAEMEISRPTFTRLIENARKKAQLIPLGLFIFGLGNSWAKIISGETIVL